MDAEANIRKIIMGVLAARPPALRAVAIPKYQREIVIIQQNDKTRTVFLALWGYHYKNRGTRPKTPPVIDIDAVTAIFNSAFQGLYRVSARSIGTHILLSLEEIT